MYNKQIIEMTNNEAVPSSAPLESDLVGAGSGAGVRRSVGLTMDVVVVLVVVVLVVVVLVVAVLVVVVGEGTWFVLFWLLHKSPLQPQRV